MIVFHDAANDDVRAGLEAVRFEEHPHTAFVNLDFIPGYLVADPVRHLEIWNGLAIVLLDDERPEPPITEFAFFDSALVLRQARERAQARSREVEAVPVTATGDERRTLSAQRPGGADRHGTAVALASAALVGLAAGLAAGRASR